MCHKNYHSDVAKEFEKKVFRGWEPLFSLHNEVICYLISQYELADHRCTKGGNNTKYKFNYKKENHDLGFNRVSIYPNKINKIIVIRFAIDDSIPKEQYPSFKSDYSTVVYLNDRNGIPKPGVEIVISSKKDIKNLPDFMSKFHINGFKRSPEAYKITSNDPFNQNQIKKNRTVLGKVIEVNQFEYDLTMRFLEFIHNIDASDISLEECINVNDRLDVSFRLRNMPVMAELKSVYSHGNSSKRSIRAALGQLLDYQYYDAKTIKSELWIVIDGKVLEKDLAFVKRLKSNLGLNLVLVYELNGQFVSH